MPWEWTTTCPHCGVYSQFQNRTQYVDQQNSDVYYSIATCVKCKGVIHLRVESNEFAEMHPTLVRKAPQGVPAQVASDYLEAARCVDAGAPRAAAAMFRRTVQSIMVEQGAKGETLYSQIEDLAQRALVTPPLKDWAHEVRVLGKAGAHADVPDDVSPEDAKDGLNFTEELIKHVYVMPAEIRRRRQRQTALAEEQQ